MNETRKDPVVPLAIEQFKRAAIVLDFGHIDEDNAMQDAGLDSAKRAVLMLDGRAEGRKALKPLLDDPNPAIRVLAARHLLKIVPETALAVLQDVRRFYRGVEAGMSAARIIWAYERGDLKN
jgi:hypothetical protein